MFGQQRQMPIYVQHSMYPSLDNQIAQFNQYRSRAMPGQNPTYPQPMYNHYFNGTSIQGPTPNVPIYSHSNGMNPVNNGVWKGGANGYMQNQNVSQLLFENPLQPQTEGAFGGGGQLDFPPQNMNPYPQQAYLPKQSSGFQSVINSFKSQDGNLDVNKMIDTAGQMMNAVTQVSSMVKGLGGFFKT